MPWKTSHATPGGPSGQPNPMPQKLYLKLWQSKRLRRPSLRNDRKNRSDTLVPNDEALI